jgi:hypothetical protein
LVSGGSEFTVAVAIPDVVVPVLQAARKASRLRAPPATSAEACKKLLRLKEAPKIGSVPMKDLLLQKASVRPPVTPEMG